MTADLDLFFAAGLVILKQALGPGSSQICSLTLLNWCLLSLLSNFEHRLFQTFPDSAGSCELAHFAGSQ